MKKKLLACILCLAMFGSSPSGVNAQTMPQNNTSDKYVCVNTEIPNLYDNYSKDSILCDKLQYEAKNHSSVLSPEVEARLNEMGLFDDELTDLSEADIEALENADSISVNVNYYSYDEDGKECNLTNQEIDEMIKTTDEAYGIEYDQKSIFSQISEKLGVSPIIAHAETKTGKIDGGSIKGTLTVTYNSSKQTFHCIETFSWVGRPNFTLKDQMGLAVNSFCFIKKETVNVTHTVTETDKKYSRAGMATPKVISTKKTTKTTHPKTLIWDKDRTSFYAEVNLWTNKTGFDNDGYKHAYSYTDEKITISCDATVSIKSHAKKGNEFPISFLYYHGIKKVTSNTSLSIAADSSLAVSSSASVSFTIVDRFIKWNNAPSIDFMIP